LDDFQAAQVHAISETREYQQDQQIADVTSFASALYFIDSGVVQLSSTTLRHHYVVLSTGDLFGALPAHGHDHAWDARALTGATVLVVDQAAFGDLLSQYPAIASCVISNLLAHATALQQRLEKLALEQPPHRLVGLLLRLATHHGLVDGKDILLRMKLTYADLSRMTGVPATLVRSLIGQWQKAGALSRERSLWRLDPEQLRRLSSEAPTLEKDDRRAPSAPA